jgi:4-hydroxybenzoate polyprenyltransferase
MSVSTTICDARPEGTLFKTSATVLCVNLDDTLVLTNLLLESLLLLIKQNPLFLLRIPLWLFRGVAVLKAEVASRVTVDPTSLPYDYELIAWLTAERTSGRSLWLCADSNELLAECIAQHLKLFDGVLASDRCINLVAKTKASKLVRQFGKGRFDYCGSGWKELAIWRQAQSAVVVRGRRRLTQETARCVPTASVSAPLSSRYKAFFLALRPHQWAKNGLVVVPLLAAHQLTDLSAALAGLMAVMSFCLCASSVYVLNDLLDLNVDRAHPRKCKRPFAAGRLPLSVGFFMAPALLGLAFGMAALLHASFTAVLAGYYVLTLAYSFSLKEKILIDALVLACLYTLRIVAGVAAVDVPLSFWMLLFSVLLFMSLAFVKRYAELDALQRRDQLQAIGSGYEVRDLPILQSLGCASGYFSVLVLALYVNSPEIEALYRHPQYIWALCVLILIWISWVWMKAQRGRMDDDPVVFAFRDGVSVSVGCLAVLIQIFAL